MSSEKRVYSEQETSAILQKAARMQEASAEGAYTPGITREELERIAAEAGIDPKFVGKALENLETEQPKRSWLNLSEEYERVIEGEVDPDDFDQIFQDLKPSQMGHASGGLRQVGRTVSMQTFYKGAMCSVEITSRKGRTRVKVKSVPFTAYFMSLHPAIILGAVLGANLGARGSALIGALTFFLAMLFGVMGFAGLVKKGHSSARQLVEELEKRVEGYTSELRTNLVKSRPVPVTQESKPVEELRDLPG